MDEDVYGGNVMHYKSQNMSTRSTIECCHYCVPPKRHTACHGHCPEYLAERAAYEEKKAQADKKQKVKSDIYCQKADMVTKAIKKHGR